MSRKPSSVGPVYENRAFRYRGDLDRFEGSAEGQGSLVSKGWRVGYAASLGGL